MGAVSPPLLKIKSKAGAAPSRFGFFLIFVTLCSLSVYSQTFAVKQRILTAPLPYGIKAVDVNRDGNQDLVWFSSDHNLEIRLGSGDGRFSTTGPIYDTTLDHAREFEVADMDRDGNRDIVVAGDHSIVVLRGNGDGTFRIPIAFDLISPGGIDSLALGDFNKDGRMDALVSIDTSIQVVFGKGDGSFQSPAKIFPNGLVGQHGGLPGQVSQEAESGDFDGDGNLDVAFDTCCDTQDDSLLFGGTLWVWYGDGQGNFPVKQAVQIGIAQVTMKVFDINHDGKADILYVSKACQDSCTYQVYTLLSIGSRTFSTTSAFAGKAIRTGVTFGDFDLDGILDLATGSNDAAPAGLFIFRRHANGAIEDAQLRSFGNTIETDPSEIIGADFNNDGKADLALTFPFDGNSILVMLNTSTAPGPCSSGPLLSVHMCVPANNSTAKSPVHVSARANSDRTITGWKIYVDGVSKVSGVGANVGAFINLGNFNFSRRIEAKAWDATGRSFSQTVFVMVH